MEFRFPHHKMEICNRISEKISHDGRLWSGGANLARLRSRAYARRTLSLSARAPETLDSLQRRCALELEARLLDTWEVGPAAVTVRTSESWRC